jgi:pimeloyl-ACP methyl ester carboxylesterase
MKTRALPDPTTGVLVSALSQARQREPPGPPRRASDDAAASSLGDRGALPAHLAHRRGTQVGFSVLASLNLARPNVIGSILATPPEVVENADAQEQARVAQILDHILPCARRRGLMNDAAIASTLSRYPLERIQAPTLVISLADDRFGTYAGARYTAERIPSARFGGYAGGATSG